MPKKNEITIAGKSFEELKQVNDHGTTTVRNIGALVPCNRCWATVSGGVSSRPSSAP